MLERAEGRKLPVEKLRWTCEPDSLGVESTADAQQLGEKVISQERAVSALRFGMKMTGTDYNVFVAGENQTGLTFLTRSFIEEGAKLEPAPPDWCYVYNFRSPDTPKAISLPQGRGQELAKDMEELLEHLRSEIPEAFESEDYRRRREEASRKFAAQRNNILSELEAKALEEGFLLNVSQKGMMIIPAKDNQPLTEEDLANLNEEEKNALRQKSEELQEEMNASVAKIRKSERDLKKSLQELDRRVALAAVGDLIEELQQKYEEFRPVLSYLVDVKNDVIKNLADFKAQEQAPSPFPIQQPEADFTRYLINVLVDNTEAKGAPVIYENNPTYNNLFGAVERKASFGALFTDFTMIRSGSMHKANGGYLVLQAKDLLKWFLSWEALKRALRNKEITIEDQAEMLGVISTKGLKPEPIPLKIKIILIGEPYIYQLLYIHDEQFKKLFKVKAHLDDKVDRNDEELSKYVGFAARMVQRYGLRHLDKTGLARLLEYGVEMAGRQKKLTLKMALIRDIMREADYWAKMAADDTISREHVEAAIKQKKFRSGLEEEKLREFLLDGYINVDTSGEKAGQINGLSVYEMGDHMFGRPSRITASISMGRQGVVAIDRESKLSGNIHTKGILIMEGYLKGKYALDRPLSLSASLVFEQSYGMIDGDSASAAELFVLLSGLSRVSIKQGLAVTGAISQQGEIQPIGGVNEKIEGYFGICQARGLTGQQGVIIPEANVPDLMLNNEVIEAVRAGNFTIYAVNHADQALEILTGMPAGQRGEDGLFPEGTLNRLVEDKLTELAEKAKKMLKDNDDKDKPDKVDPPACDSCGGCD